MGTLIDIDLHVSEQNIEEGNVCSCLYCPVAMALHDILKPVYRPSVGATCFSIYVYEPTRTVQGLTREYDGYLPREATRWITAFDSIPMSEDNPQAKPITFPISLPRKVVREDVLEKYDAAHSQD